MKRLKRIVATVLACAMAFAMVACSGNTGNKGTDDTTGANANGNVKVKAGFITLHDENSTYDANFINAAKEACEKMGIEYELKTNIPEGQECYEAACDLVDDGCNFIFADSFGHEDYIISAAKEYPNVQFAHATGTKAHTAGLANFHNAFAEIFEGRYLAGIVAGMKLNEMILQKKITEDQAVVGYVGAYTYAEVISGYTSFFLGVRSVCPSATMKVTFTGSWYDETAEKEGAQKLIDSGCVLISQHADSMGAPTACENNNVPNVSYNGSTKTACPNTFLVSSRINWAPYFEYAMSAIAKGENFDTDWCGDISTGSVVLTELNDQTVAEGTADAIETAKAALEKGDVHVFATDSFTVGGETLTSYMADVDTDANYEGDHEVIKDGYFEESGKGLRSAPYFNLRIDGITLLDEQY